MRLVFAGYGELGATVLEALAQQYDVSVVLTHPTDFSGLGEPDVAETAARLGIDVLLSRRAQEPQIVEALAEAHPDVLVSTNWRTRLPLTVLNVPKLGCLNVHDALLPAYSGFGAINWAIRNGETETGVTVHRMEETFDSGPIMARQRVPIGPDDPAALIYRRVLDRYVPAVLEALPALEAGDPGAPQDHSLRTFYHRIELADTEIDWSLPSRDVYNLVRGQSDPYINAWTTSAGRRLFVKAAAVPTENGYGGTPGRVIGQVDGGVAVTCGRPGAPGSRGLLLHTVRFEGDPAAQPAVDVFKRAGGRLGSIPR